MYSSHWYLILMIGVASATNPRVRGDGKCGSTNPLPDGSPSECDPNGSAPCCSKWGHCGNTADYCDCPECVRYSTQQASGV